MQSLDGPVANCPDHGEFNLHTGCLRCPDIAEHVPHPMLIALCSPAMGAGKSVVARRLMEKHGFKLVKFADVLKQMTRAFLHHALALPAGAIEDMIEGRLKETPIDGLDVTPRKIMQTLGTEWGRNCLREDLWVHLVGLKVQAMLAMGHSIVIDDMRYPNEMAKVRELGGTCIRVTRPGIADATGHSSEGGLAGEIMLTIDNAGRGLDSLRHMVDAVLNDIRAGTTNC